MLKQIGISDVWAGKLMAIGANAALSNPNHGSDLPQTVKALYELSRLPADEIEAGIEDGTITPDTTTF